MIETHPFGAFIPNNIRFLIVGTFPGRKYAQRSEAENEADELAFSYGGRNHLWKIMSLIFDEELKTRNDKKKLLARLEIGLMDLYLQVERLKNSNLDSDLRIVQDNKLNLAQLLENKQLEKIFCTGKGVADILKKWFPEYESKIVALPSPSPAARISMNTKLEAYRKAFIDK